MCIVTAVNAILDTHDRFVLRVSSSSFHEGLSLLALNAALIGK
jgi:hypothetical protein